MRISWSKVRPKRRALRRATAGAMAISPRYGTENRLRACVLRCAGVPQRLPLDSRAAVWDGSIGWEGQYIGRAIFATVRGVPARHLRIGDEGDGERIGREVQTFLGGGEKLIQGCNGNTNAPLLIENHAGG